MMKVRDSMGYKGYVFAEICISMVIELMIEADFMVKQ